jgi:hypothetical protein
VGEFHRPFKLGYDNYPNVSGHLNSRLIQRKMSCPGGSFHRFVRSYLRTLSLLYDEMPKVEINEREMVVRFNHTSRTYTLV